MPKPCADIEADTFRAFNVDLHELFDKDVNSSPAKNLEICDRILVNMIDRRINVPKSDKGQVKAFDPTTTKKCDDSPVYKNNTSTPLRNIQPIKMHKHMATGLKSDKELAIHETSFVGITQAIDLLNSPANNRSSQGMLVSDSKCKTNDDFTVNFDLKTSLSQLFDDAENVESQSCILISPKISRTKKTSLHKKLSNMSVECLGMSNFYLLVSVWFFRPR